VVVPVPDLQLPPQVAALRRRRHERRVRAQGAVQRRGLRVVGRRARRRPQGLRLHQQLPPKEGRRLAGDAIYDYHRRRSWAGQKHGTVRCGMGRIDDDRATCWEDD
jgi:hypothetical protein